MQSPVADVVHPLHSGGAVEVKFSTKQHGDFHIDQDRDVLRQRRSRFTAGHWTQLDEVHGTVVRQVRRNGEHDFLEGDAMYTDSPGAVLGVWVGDCAPVAFIDPSGRIGAAHAGWRGAHLGVLESLVHAMGAGQGTHAYLGPCIHACCYEFGDSDLQAMVQRFGDQVAATTLRGTPALDMRAVITAALVPLGVVVHDVSVCTGCASRWYYSHRMRSEAGRQVMAVRRLVAA